ncbi:MAG: hypothetical protein HGB26_06560, partial [Desulfobulbaceae bacterium]|nr:hypothetical protein [Desulfobulbaceae bacterium]
MKKNLFGLFFFILLILLVELVMGLFHLEKYDSLFVQRSSYPFFIPGTGSHANNYVTNPHFSYQLNLQAFPLVKKRGVLRIFILGGSAAYGFPYTEEYGFSGYLRRALNNVAPGKFEIIDAAGMSFGSHRVLDELRDIVNYDPDLVIINSGNNEYVEKNILPPNYGRDNQLQQLSGLLAKTDTYRAMRLGLFRIFPKPFQRQVARDMTDIRSNTEIRRAGMNRSTETEREVLANYQKNLSDMKQLLAQKGIKGIFSTVPNNVATWAPMNTPPLISQPQNYRKWLELQKKIGQGLAIEKATNQEVFLELEGFLQESLRIFPDHARNLYDLGKVEMVLGRYDAAYESFVKARDLDTKPIRALSSFNATIRNLVPKDDHDFAMVDLDAAVMVDTSQPENVQIRGNIGIQGVQAKTTLSPVRLEGLRADLAIGPDAVNIT